MGIYCNDNGTLRNIVAVYTNDNGTLRQIVSVYANDNGTLREIPVTPVQLNGGSYSDFSISPGDSFVQIRLNSTGEFEVAQGGAFITAYNWLLAGSASDYEVRVHNNGPDALNVGTVDTWQGLGTSRTFGNTETGVGTVESELVVSIRRASDSEVLVTATITLTSTVDL